MTLQRNQCERSLVLLDVDNATAAVAESFHRALRAKPFDQRICRATNEIGREFHRIDAPQDNIVRSHGIRARKWRAAGQQLKHQNAQRPIVGRMVVPLAENDLRRNVFRRAAECPRLTANSNALGETEIALQKVHSNEEFISVSSSDWHNRISANTRVLRCTQKQSRSMGEIETRAPRFSFPPARMELNAANSTSLQIVYHHHKWRNCTSDGKSGTMRKILNAVSG